MNKQDQLHEAEMALWKIFNISQRAKPSKVIIEINTIVKNYLNEKVNQKEKERGDPNAKV